MWPFRSGKNKHRPTTSSEQNLTWEAVRSGNVDHMLQALQGATDPLDRHLLLESIVREAFKLRKKDHKMRDLCQEVGLQHLEEFPQIAERLKVEIGYGAMPYVITFHCVATVLAEWGAYKKAIDVYEMALSYGIDDAIDGGFHAKIVGLRNLMRS